MNDDKKRPPRGSGPRQPGGRDGGDRKGYGKPRNAGDRPFRKRPEGEARAAGENRFERPRREREGDRPERTEKPFAKRREGGGGERFGGPRLKQGRDERPERGEKPFRSGPRPGGKPFAGRGEGARPRGELERGERIAKRLARAGISSRRDAEQLIEAGRVTVNGKVLSSPAFNVGPEDRIELDGTEIPPVERTRLFLFHKPAGVVTTNRDPEGRKTVFDILPKDLPRLMTVGRLDINTEGLLLLTNDGGLARVLELPATGWLRRYRVRVHGRVDEKALADLKNGIAVDGVFYGAIEATLDREQGSNAWLTIGLREGKNREVKNVLGALGLEVSRLIRVSYGPFQLGELPEGAVQELKGRTLRDQLGERLIEEAGADFDAPVATPFSNQPVRQGHDETAERPARPPREGEREPRGARRERDGKREHALGRLQTKPGRFGKPGDKEPRREQPARSRSSNVWMAPGARPVGKKKAEESHREDKEARRSTSRSPRKWGEGKGEGGPKERREAGPKGRSEDGWMAKHGRPPSPAGPSPRKPGDRGPRRPAGGSSGPRKPRGGT